MSEDLLKCIEEALFASWGKDTSHHRAFDKRNPASGQCLATAMVVNDYFGGSFIQCEAI